jgi:hypothetical protein
MDGVVHRRLDLEKEMPRAIDLDAQSVPLRGHVTRADTGRPLAGGTVRIGVPKNLYASGDRRYRLTQDARIEKDGAFAFESVPTGPATLTVYPWNWGSRDLVTEISLVEIRFVKDLVIDHVMRSPGTLAIDLSDLGIAKFSLDDFRFELTGSAGDSENGSPDSRAGTRAVFAHLAADTYVVEITRAYGNWNDRHLATVTGRVEPGKTTLVKASR